MRILIAEDERITRATLTRQLQSWGHDVIAAEDGEAAWEQFRAGEFDIVLTDWEMPRLSGVELIERIRAANHPNYVYLILLTGRSDKADVVRGIERGADDFVCKPFDREELRVRLLAGERVVRLERALNVQNAALRSANDRIHNDLQAAARVQRAMLPRQGVQTPTTRTAWRYVPTDELAGDAIGLELVGDRYLVAYVVDVSGHGVPAALLSVTAMHALAPSGELGAMLRGLTVEGMSSASPLCAAVITGLNQRFSSTDNDQRFLTMVMSVLDTRTGRLCFARAAHPIPILIRGGRCVPVSDEGGMPIGLLQEAEYMDVHLQLEPGDRVILYSDGVIEQTGGPADKQFGTAAFEALLVEHATATGDELIQRVVDAIAAWAGGASFADDVSLMCIDWPG